MARYRAVANRIYVWAAPCPDCHAGKDKPCQDMRTGVRAPLFGRRTHKGRREAVKAMGNPKVRPTRTTLRPARLPITGQLQITTATTTGAMASGWTVTRDEIWGTWNNTWVENGTTGTGAVVYDDVTAQRSWVRWVETGTTSQVYTHEQIYRGWVENDRDRDAFAELQAARQREHDRLQAERERATAERLARRQREMENQLVAHARSLELFQMLLTEEQRIQWREHHEVTVRGSADGLYVIEGRRETVHGNIVQVDEHGCRLARLCVAPAMWDEDGAMPTPDGWVGQLMAIRHNEEVLRRNANFSHRGRCLNPDPALTQMLRDDRIINVA